MVCCCRCCFSCFEIQDVLSFCLGSTFSLHERRSSLQRHQGADTFGRDLRSESVMGQQLAPNVDKVAACVPADIAPYVKGHTDAVLSRCHGFDEDSLEH